MPHRDSITTEELIDIREHLFGKRRYPFALASSLRQEAETKRLIAQLKQEILACKLKHAKQYNFEFHEPGEDWGTK